MSSMSSMPMLAKSKSRSSSQLVSCRLEVRLVVLQFDFPGVAGSERTLVAGEDAVVAFLEGVELVGLP